jgi:DNA repair ATPase RecN
MSEISKRALELTSKVDGCVQVTSSAKDYVEALDAVEKYITELEARIVELDNELTHWQTVYNELWDDTLIRQVCADKLESITERLIEAIELGNKIPLIHEPEVSTIQKWYAKIMALVAEWKESEK